MHGIDETRTFKPLRIAVKSALQRLQIDTLVPRIATRKCVNPAAGRDTGEHRVEVIALDRC